jgi:formate hydrogenlyase subunit 5
MVAEEQDIEIRRTTDILEPARHRWRDQAVVTLDRAFGSCRIEVRAETLRAVCQWLAEEAGYVFATLIVEEAPGPAWSLLYLFCGTGNLWAEVVIRLEGDSPTAPSLSDLAQGPAYDWHEREAEDLFGVQFKGHPRLGDFILHEDWPEGINPMRRDFDATRRPEFSREETGWSPPIILAAPGSFAMPVGPVFSDFAESAHFLLETVGEDVIRTIPRFSYKYRGVEKIAEGQRVDRVLLIAERFSGTAAFAHAQAFCLAVETICAVEVPMRAKVIRTVLGELERLRHHAATIAGICNSTALAVAASQAALIEEDLLRLSCELTRHRYLFGSVIPGGVTFDLDELRCRRLMAGTGDIAARLAKLHNQLRYSSSFLDRLEEVGVVSTQAALSYGLLGPIARASGIARDIRKLRPYGTYDAADFSVPLEHEGDGYARLRVFFREAENSAAIIRQSLQALPSGSVHIGGFAWRDGAACAAVEAPSGAAFHYVRLCEEGVVARYRLTPPAFANWHGFHVAAENFAFQDFPIILASFGLSNAECDR